MSESIIKHTVKTAATMLAFALVGTFMLAYVFETTRAPIEKSEADARVALFKQILPDERYYATNNEGHHENGLLLNNVIEIAPNALLGNKTSTKAHFANIDKKFAAIILEAIAHDGYGGDIKLLIAIREDGTLSGVRVLSHKETPGLGDYIDIAHSNWIKLFNQESIKYTPAEQWKVKKDGGKFDYMAGATITPRAVVNAVHKALIYYEKNKHLLHDLAEQKSAAKHHTKDDE
ncbi:MAG: electron transport complex subunit RsxG [Betaproteobacteria bacterium HGW-Betaproteobacteria-22]|nr:MAG: electron transport complex subunit RsxG [Betaproteobacteria bacterium HGW-Betaproteobacteria-22]